MALILTYTSSDSLNLHLHKFTPKFLISQYVLLEVTRCSITNPITNPQAYPIKSWYLIIFTFLWQLKATQSKVSLKRWTLKCPNYPPCEIGSINWFWERFKYSRNVRLVSCWGILPKRRFRERSKDSSAISVVKF